MIEVKLDLHSREERAIFNAALDAIESVRAKQQSNLDLAMHPRIEVVGTHEIVIPQDAKTVTVENDPTPDPAAERLVTDEQPNPEDAEAMMSAYLKANGMAAARAVLDKFNVKRVRDLPAEMRGELVKALVSK